jgi:hypothetical protein
MADSIRTLRAAIRLRVRILLAATLPLTATRNMVAETTATAGTKL